MKMLLFVSSTKKTANQENGGFTLYKSRTITVNVESLQLVFQFPLNLIW